MLTSKRNISRTCLNVWPAICLLLLISCKQSDNDADAYGNFEAEEIMVSAQSQGIILSLEPEEGDYIAKDKLAGMIDSTNLWLKKLQLEAQMKVIRAKIMNIDNQIKVQDEQRINLNREVERTRQLLKDNAATEQQYDDLYGKLKVFDLQTETIHSQKSIILSESTVLDAQIAEARELLRKCRIVNPVEGTVLEKYCEAGELATPGKSLYKVADISNIILRVYISESQLSTVLLNDTVSVYVDIPGGETDELTGRVGWVSSEAEFTPKIIQTREERVNMVYAVKILVKNDGRLKIGMPGEVRFNKEMKE